MSTDRRLAFGELLRRHRVAAGLTQKELAERAGLSVRGISDLERGLRPSPHRDTAERLARVLALDPGQEAELLAERVPRVGLGASRPHADLDEGHARSFRSGWTARPLTSFIGRQEQIAQLARLIETTRLITLTGPGGIGKTRLAMQIAATVRQRGAHEVNVVELSDVSEPQHVARAVALALGQPEQIGRSLEDALVERLQSADMILVLDNCEHLLAACASLANELVQQCTSLRILATSREPLAIWGEAIYRVSPLPDDDAIHLFVQRARSVLPSFGTTDFNAASVAQLCRRLDCIPLAIELAAAWVHVLSIQEITDRLDSALGLLVAGNRVGPRRQQTLRATFDWSYALLSHHEQRLFRRLSVFAGGWTIEAAESVGAGDGIDSSEVLQLLARLVNASLVVADRSNNGASRYRMLDVVRQYAHERLLTHDELAATRRRHATFFVRLAERIAPKIHQADQLKWLDTLEQEHDNCRAAFTYFGEHQDGIGELRLAGALAGFWVLRG